jgi:hypothetical protein
MELGVRYEIEKLFNCSGRSLWETKYKIQNTNLKLSNYKTRKISHFVFCPTTRNGLSDNLLYENHGISNTKSSE